MSARYYLLHVSGSYYGRKTSGAFCSTRDAAEIYYWPTLEQAEENRRWQAVNGYCYTVEAAA